MANWVSGERDFQTFITMMRLESKNTVENARIFAARGTSSSVFAEEFAECSTPASATV